MDLDTQAVSRTECTQAAAHALLHDAGGPFACAVGGVVNGGELQQFFRQLRDASGVRLLHEMKSAHQHIRLEMVDYIQDAAVGTAAEQNALFFFLYKQVLLVPELHLPL